MIWPSIRAYDVVLCLSVVSAGWMLGDILDTNAGNAMSVKQGQPRCDRCGRKLYAYGTKSGYILACKQCDIQIVEN